MVVCVLINSTLGCVIVEQNDTLVETRLAQSAIAHGRACRGKAEQCWVDG